MRDVVRLSALLVLVALVVPSTALASPVPAGAEEAASVFDTPRPTPRPRGGDQSGGNQSGGNQSGGSQSGGDRSGGDRSGGDRSGGDQSGGEPDGGSQGTDPFVDGTVQVPDPVPPTRDFLTVAYRGDSIVAQAPLLVALLRGYFAEAGIPDVTLVRATDPSGDVRSGATDLAVVRGRDVVTLVERAPDAKVVAGYQNYGGANGAFGGDVLVARPGLVAHEPATVSAFLGAYVRGLRDLADPISAAEALEIIEEGSDVAMDPAEAAGWQTAILSFAPFDGGFGAVADEGGLGELSAFLQAGAADEPDLGTLVASHPLSLAQARLGLPLNPRNALILAPGLTEISIGLPGAETSSSPIVVAAQAGYFEDAGFESVEIVDVERALPGVMTGQLDFAVVDLQDAADGFSQGLPFDAVAGHANYGGADGTYGGDLIIASPDLVDDEASTVRAFLTAYVRALRDLDESVGSTDFAPFDGGFGDRTIEGGLGELQSALDALARRSIEADELVDETALIVAQAWHGLPANPTTAPPLVAAAVDEAAVEEAA